MQIVLLLQRGTLTDRAGESAVCGGDACILNTGKYVFVLHVKNEFASLYDPQILDRARPSTPPQQIGAHLRSGNDSVFKSRRTSR